MTTLTINNLSDDLAQSLSTLAARKGTSIDTTVKRLLRQGVQQEVAEASTSSDFSELCGV